MRVGFNLKFNDACAPAREVLFGLATFCLAAWAMSQQPTRPAGQQVVDQLCESTVYIENQLVLSQADWNAIPAEGRAQMERPQGPASGSGFIVSADGYIVTNAHVIGDMEQAIPLKDGTQLNWHFISTSLSVVVRSGEGDEQTYLPRVIKVNQGLDLAVLKITPQAPLKPLKINPAQEIKGGLGAVMAGFPGGKSVGFAPFAGGIQNARPEDIPNPRVAINTGTISSVRRFKGSVRYQLDIGANHGNSGGPITNPQGEVIGVLYAGIDGMNSINYAIPVRYLKNVLPSAITANWPISPQDESAAEQASGEQKFEEFVDSGTFKLK